MKEEFIDRYRVSLRKWKERAFVITVSLILQLNPIIVQAEDIRPDYTIMVNRAANCTTVYEKDPATGEFTVPVIAFACSTGKNNATRTGAFRTGSASNYYPWRQMIKNVYAQYAVRFNGSILFHSVPYYKCDPGTLEMEEYNRLGEQASAGCVRMACIDAKWIYDNCKPGTQVIVYDDFENAGAFGTPVSLKLAWEGLGCGWDPTDPDINNPWRLVRPVLKLTSDTSEDDVLYLPAGSTVETLKSSIGLFTPQGSVYLPDSYILEIYGHYDLNTPGNYLLYVRGFDIVTGLRADQTFMLCVLLTEEDSQSSCQ